MGSISIDNTSLEKRLADMEAKLEAANVERRGQAGLLLDRVRNLLSVTRWLNWRTEKVYKTGEGLSDVKDGIL